MLDNVKVCNVTWYAQYGIWEDPYRHQHASDHYQDREQNRS
jgi:hypothetical protein